MKLIKTPCHKCFRDKNCACCDLKKYDLHECDCEYCDRREEEIEELRLTENCSCECHQPVPLSCSLCNGKGYFEYKALGAA